MLTYIYKKRTHFFNSLFFQELREKAFSAAASSSRPSTFWDETVEGRDAIGIFAMVQKTIRIDRK